VKVWNTDSRTPTADERVAGAAAACWFFLKENRSPAMSYEREEHAVHKEDYKYKEETLCTSTKAILN
jgi:hypothetical protein